MKSVKSALTTPIGAISAVFAMVLQMNAASVYYDSHATGANDGSSWADAYSDLQAAITAAGDGGEVRIAKGVHTPITTKNLSDAITIGNVKISGGWSADGRVEDPSLTILNGDLNGDDRYVDVNGSEICKLLDGDKLPTFRDPMLEEGVWALDMSKVSDNAYRLFVVDTTAQSDYSQVIENLSVVGFGGNTAESFGTIYKNASNGCFAEFKNCLFVGNSCKGGNSAGQIYIQNDCRFVNCRFFGYYNTCISYSTTASTKGGALVKGCMFAYSRMYGDDLRSCGLSPFTSACIFVVEDCTFKYLDFGFRSNNGYGSCLNCHSGSYRKVENCTFDHVFVTNAIAKTTASSLNLSLIRINTVKANGACSVSNCVFSSNTVVADLSSSAIVSASTMDSCLFKGNTYVQSSTSETLTVLCSVGGVANDCVFEGNVVQSASPVALLSAGTLDFGRYAGNRVSGVGTADAKMLSSGSLHLAKICASDNVVSVENGVFATLMENGTAQADGYCAEGASIVNNTVLGGLTNALIKSASVKFMNSVVAFNHQLGRNAENDYLSAVVLASSDTYMLWSDFYENDAMFELWSFNVSGNNVRLFMNSSICWRENPDAGYSFRGGYLTPGSSKHTTSDLGVTIYNSCICGFDESRTDLYTVSKNGLFTDNPMMSPNLCETDDGRYYVQLKSSTPYKKSGMMPYRSLVKMNNNDPPGTIIVDFAGAGTAFKCASNGNLSSGISPVDTDKYVNAGDFTGAARSEDAVALGAVQNWQKSGMMLLLR